MIRVRSSPSVEFENFTLTHPKCPASQNIWLAFGGDVPGIVVSMLNDNFRKPGVDLQVEDVSYRILKDDNFRRFYALISARHGEKAAYKVTATLTGTFLAGAEVKSANGQSYYAGYGHLGCCSLFVIQQVSDVDSVPSANLNVEGILLGPDGSPLAGFVVFDDILGGSPPERQQFITGKSGKFRLSNSGQLLRFENANYRPLAVDVEPGGPPIRVKLEAASRSDWTLVPCSQIDSSNRIGFSVLFSLPSTMESSPFDNDGTQSLFIFPHGSSAPEARLIVSSSANSESTTSATDSGRSQQRWIKDTPGKIIGIDARGKTRGYGYWRTATFFSRDEVGYTLQKRESPAVLDKIIDSACIK